MTQRQKVKIELEFVPESGETLWDASERALSEALARAMSGLDTDGFLIKSVTGGGPISTDAQELAFYSELNRSKEAS